MISQAVARDLPEARHLEVELLLACARNAVSTHAKERIRVLARGVSDWPFVLSAASEHGIRPLLYRNLNTICPDLVPETVTHSLRAFALENAQSNLLLSAELLKLLDGFKDRGIAAIPFKGPVLGSWAYGDLAIRESSDLDIVVPRRNLPEAIGFLLEQGYSRRNPVPNSATPYETEQAVGRYNVFHHSDSLATVDLQASLEGPHFSFTLDDPDIWNHTIFQSFARKTVLSFCAEDLLIILSVHGAKDVWFQLKWICDIAEFIDRHPTIDWDLALHRAIRFGAKRKLLLAVCLAGEVLGAPLPNDISDRVVREPMVIRSAETIIKRLFIGDRAISDSERVAFYFQLDDTSWDRTKRYLRYGAFYLRIVFVPSGDGQNSRFPRWLSHTSYLLRPIRLIAKYGTKPRLAARVFREWFRSMD